MHIDFISLLLSSLAFGGLLYGLSAAGDKGWGSPYVYVTLIIGIISLIWFILRQLKQDAPMLNFQVYQYPMFALSSVIAMIINMALFSGMLLLPIYVQTIRGISPMDAGLLLLPGALLMAFMSPVTGRLFDKFGARVLAIIGITIIVVTTYYFTNLKLDTPYTQLLIIYSVRMLGIAMVMMPISTNGLNQLPKRLYPHGTAMNNTLNQVSGAIGTALLVTIMSNRTATHAKEIAKEAMKNVTGNPTGAALAEMKHQITMKAMLEGINDSFLVATGIAAVALILAFFIKRATQVEDMVEGERSSQKIAAEN